MTHALKCRTNTTVAYTQNFESIGAPNPREMDSYPLDNSPSDIPPYHARLELELEVGLVGLGLSLVWLVSGLGFELG